MTQINLPHSGKTKKTNVSVEQAQSANTVSAGSPLSEEFDLKLFVSSCVKSMRVWQWSKNMLMFVPFLFAQQYNDFHKLFLGIVGFVLFGLCASATYIWNDLRDLPNDRKHPTKSKRPIASGALSPLSATILSVALVTSGTFGVYLLSNPPFFCFVIGYVFITVLYSLYLKRAIVIDVLVLSGLYTYRMFLGASLMDIGLSPWILAFSMFFFLSLAFVKRFAELQSMGDATNKKLAGRGYLPLDGRLVESFGTGAGLIAVLVFALYISSPTVKKLYKSPELLWLVCPLLLYWIVRIWFIAFRGKLHEDPVVFAIKDFRSAVIGAVCVGIITVAAKWQSDGLLERVFHLVQ
jgi:4-hydroxybenzoate polyprenyltransferase